MSKKRVALLVLSIFFIGLGVAGYFWWHSQTSTSEVSYGSADGAVLGSDTNLVDWQTAYFTTRVASNLRQLTSKETPAAATVGAYLFGSTARNNTSQVGVTVGKLGGYSLNEIPAVKLRLNSAALYVPTSRTYAPTGAVGFTSTNNGYEASVFWQHGDEYVAVVASGTADHSDDLNQAIATVTRNWQWK